MIERKTIDYKFVALSVAAFVLVGLGACTSPDTVIQTVVHTVEVERVVTEQVIQTVEVVVTPTATPAPTEFEPASPPAPQSREEEVVIALFDVGVENGRNSNGAGTILNSYGLTETLFMRGPADETLPWIGTTWSISTDLSSVTIEIDNQAEFRWIDDNGVVESLGNVSAEDVAWSMNDASTETNSESDHRWGRDYAGIFGEWVAIDDDTVAFDLNFFGTGWNSFFLSESGPGIPVFSKTVFERSGAEFTGKNLVGTGVYLVEEWNEHDSLTQVLATSAGGSDHWKFDTGPERITFVEVPEFETRAALLKSSEIDIAHIQRSDVLQFSRGGFPVVNSGSMAQQGIFFSGNLWEEVSAIDGEPLTRDTYRHDIAWIGNPDNADDMQEARSIRNALARAYDRDAINQSLLGGLGIPVEVQYVSTQNPRWRNEWNYGYDPELAKRILRGESDEWPLPGGASYRQDQTTDEQQMALNGNAFSISLYAGSGAVGFGTGLGGEIIDAVAGYWADLGLTVSTLKFSYPTFRPSLVGRTNTHPVVSECDNGFEAIPWHRPKGLVQTSLTRGGFGCGFEVPFVLDFFEKITVEPDEEVRNQLVDSYIQFMYDEALQPGIFAIPQFWVMNPNKVTGWNIGKSEIGNIGRVWEIELK